MAPDPGVRSARGETFEAFFREVYPQLVRIAYRVIGERDTAQDVAQDVLLTAYGRFPEQLTNPAAWVRAATVHHALNHIRATRRRGRREARHVPIAVGPQPEESALAAEDRRRVRDALARLSKEKAAVLILRHSGLSYVEVAQALGISPSSVGTTLRRAEELLRREVTR